jgi:hypothetical protein
LFSSVCDFLSADVGAVSRFFAVETLVILPKFCHFVGGMCLPKADLIDGVDIHGISSLSCGATPPSVTLLVVSLSHFKGLVELSTCIWAVGASFSPLAMLFLGFFYPSVEGPCDLWIIGIG